MSLGIMSISCSLSDELRLINDLRGVFPLSLFSQNSYSGASGLFISVTSSVEALTIVGERVYVVRVLVVPLSIFSSLINSFVSPQKS